MTRLINPDRQAERDAKAAMRQIGLDLRTLRIIKGR